MVDKASFRRTHGDYDLPSSNKVLRSRSSAELLTDDELIVASPIVYGFSLNNRRWCKCRC